MILSTTPTLEGRHITEYQGLVFGEVIIGINFVKDFAASFTDFFGGRSSTYENELTQARDEAINEMEERALENGADAVVGIRVEYEVLGQKNGMILVTVSGTAVKLA